ncbi:MAG: Hpt domain-containing protein [Pseudomonadota bacterium]
MSDAGGQDGQSSGADQDLAELTRGFLRRKQEEFVPLSRGPRLDLEGLANAAHRLRGSGGAYGFDVLSDIAERLEQAAAREQHDAARQALTELLALLDSLQAQTP